MRSVTLRYTLLHVAVLIAATGIAFADHPYTTNPAFKAAYTGDLPAIKRMLKVNPKLINAPFKGYMGVCKGDTLLIAAVNGEPAKGQRKGDQLSMAKYLLAKGARVDAVGYFSITPLHCVTGESNTDLALAQMFLAKGANPNAKDDRGETPLHYAVNHYNLPKYDSSRVVRALVKGGAKADVANKDGKTPLDLAADKPAVLSILQGN